MLVQLLFVHLAATVFMTGLIWFVQIVHYPMFQYVGEDVFVNYEKIHQRLTTYVVGPAMLVEAGTAAYLLWRSPVQIGQPILWTGVVLLVVAWGVTAAVSVPLHEKLSSGFDAPAHKLLVDTNWIRTFAWSARSVIACLAVHKFLTFREIAG